MDSNTVTESDLSLKSRSFLHRVNDRVRKMLDQSSKDAMQDSNKHSLIWWVFMSSTLEASVFMGKNYSENLHSIKNTEDLTMKQMFDISEKLTTEQSDETYGVTPINWEDSSWKQLSLVSDEEVISLSHAKVYVFSDSVLCLGKMHQNPKSNTVWEDKLTWFKIFITIQNFGHNRRRTDGFRVEYYHRMHYIGACPWSPKVYEQKWATQRNSKDELSSCRCWMTSFGELKTMNRNVLLIPHLCLYLQKDFQQDVGHSSESLNWWW